MAFAAEEKLIDPPEVLAKPQPTVHSKPDWMKDLKKNFSKEIVEVCSERTRTAVKDNEDVQVRDNIKNGVHLT